MSEVKFDKERRESPRLLGKKLAEKYKNPEWRELLTQVTGWDGLD